MNARALLDTVVAFAIFTFVASSVFVFGTHHIHMYRLPTIQWWQYVFYYGYSRNWDRWLLIGAAAGAVPAAALLLRTAWDSWGKRFFFRLRWRALRSEE